MTEVTTLGETACNYTEQMHILGNGVTNTHHQWGEKTCQRGLPGQDRAHSDTHPPDESGWMTDGEQAQCSWLRLASAQTENRAKSETS